MRIGIDASRGFSGELTGTERYAFEMITRIVSLPEASLHEWVLYIREEIKNQEQTEARIKAAIRKNGSNQDAGNIRVVNIACRYLWTQAGLAYKTWRDNLDVLWVPAHTLPVLRRGFFGLGGKMRTVVTIHGIEYEWLPAYENWLQRWYLPLSTIYAVREATNVVAVSKFTKQQLVERMGAEPGKISVVWEGYERRAEEEKIKYPGVLVEFGLRKNKYVLFVGTVQPRKNLKRLIEAFLRLNLNDYKLVICGKWGWNCEDVESIIKNAGAGRVVITGYLEESKRRQLLAGAVAYVQPSITEGFGLPVLEAMEADVPVAASSGGALPEVVGSAGVIFDPLDVEQMSKAIFEVVGDEKLRRRLKAAGKMRLKKFGWDNAAREVFKILTYKKS